MTLDGQLLPDDGTTHLSSSFKEIKTISSLKVLYTNADQFLNKRDDLLLHITGNEPDIIIMITKVQPSFISDAQLYIPGYNLVTNFKLNCDQN